MENKENSTMEISERETYSFWDNQINEIKKDSEYKAYLKTANIILNRYQNRKNTAKSEIVSITEYGDSRICNDGYNVIFKITETILPFLIPYIPEIIVERQNKDKDPVGNLASRILERCLNNFTKEPIFKNIIDIATKDGWIQGQGVAWLGKEEIIKRTEIINELGETTIQDVMERQEITIDYVAPEDFFHNKARNEKELDWVARRVFLSKEDFEREFEKDASNYLEKGEKAKTKNKAIVFEIWDKVDRKIRYFAEQKREEGKSDELLKSEDYPEGFDFDFPCECLQFVKKTNSLIPTPILDNIIYLQELIDTQTRKIKSINDDLQIKGVYDKSIGQLEKALSSNNENKLYPIEFNKDGSLQNAIMFFPLQEIITALQTNIDARQNNIDKAMELIGDNPILEGITNSQDAYGTNRLKGSFGTMRVQEYQKYKVEFLDKLLKKIGTIFCSFADYFLVEYSNIEFDTNQEDRALLPQAIKLLKNEKLKKCRLIIETDSTKAYYDESYRTQLNEFFTSLINDLNQSAGIIQAVPSFAGVFKAIVMAKVRSQRVGRNFESDIERAIDQSIQQLMMQQSQPQDNGKMQAEIQKSQVELQKANIMAQQKSQELQARVQIETMKQQAEDNRQQEVLKKDYRQQDINQQIAETKALLEKQKLDLAREELHAEAMLKAQGLNANIGTNLM